MKVTNYIKTKMKWKRAMNKERFTADLKTVTFCILVYQCSIGFRLLIIMCNNLRLHYNRGDILPIKKPGVPIVCRDIVFLQD